MATKLYPEQDHPALGDWYVKHVQAMTQEGLHAKSDIAAQLAWRDRLIEDLQGQVKKLFATGLAYCDKIEALQMLTKELASVLRPILVHVESIEDEGPEGEGWQSEKLQAQITAANTALAKAT